MTLLFMGVSMKKVYEISGDEFDTLEEFYEHISQVLIPRSQWGKNLDAFNDILRGGFGTPEEGFIIKWRNSSRSREKLAYAETVRYLENKLSLCHPDNRESVQIEIQRAQKGEGQTLFDTLIEIIREHGPEGNEPQDGVDLVLL